MSGNLFAKAKPHFLEDSTHQQASRTFWKNTFQRFCQNRLAICGLIILFFLILMAIIGPFLTPYTYYETHLHLKNLPPSKTFWFGSDELGRDIFTRIWWGARISLFVGFSAAFIDMVIGVFYGAFSGMCRGKIDELMMRVADILYSLPQLLITILLLVIMGPGILTIIISMTFMGWINMARIVRSQILQLMQNDFIIAAKTLGCSRFRILIKHLIPNIFGTIITTVTLTIPLAIFIEAFLSFLGLGIQAPIASWGTMAHDGLPAMRYYPWRLFLPAGFISLTMLSLNLVGDGMRNAFDLRIRLR